MDTGKPPVYEIAAEMISPLKWQLGRHRIKRVDQTDWR